MLAFKIYDQYNFVYMLVVHEINVLLPLGQFRINNEMIETQVIKRKSLNEQQQNHRLITDMGGGKISYNTSYFVPQEQIKLLTPQF